MPSDPDIPTIRRSGLETDVAEMDLVALSDRWGLALFAEASPNATVLMHRTSHAR